MEANTSASILSVVLSGLTSGIVVAVLNYFLTRRKTHAEIRKLESEAEKIRLESEKLRKELTTNIENLASASYQLTNSLERIIYDTKNRDIGYDFRGVEGYVWETVEGKTVRTTGKAQGILTFENAILNLHRANTDGRYEIWLHTYSYGESIPDRIPKDDLIAGKRRLRVSFEAKVVGGEHTLKFVFKGLESEKWLAQGERRIASEKWQPHTMHFLVSAQEESRLRIGNQFVTKAPSSVQIRSFVLAERNN